MESIPHTRPRRIVRRAQDAGKGILVPQREFSLGDILSVTTPFCITSMDDMITVLEFMTGEKRGSDMWTLYAIPRCAESLLQQHPQLAGITTPDEFTDLDHIDQWLADQEIVYGKTLTVSTLADTAAAAQ